MSLPVKSCYPGDPVTCPEALDAWCNAVETRLAALEERQLAPVHAPNDDPKVLKVPFSLWEQMDEAAAKVTGEYSDACGVDGAAMIRVVAAYIATVWAGRDSVNLMQLMKVLETEAKIADRS